MSMSDPASNYNTLYDSASGGNPAPPASARRTPSKHKRLASLDIVRGFTIALMIFVDEVGDAYPHLNHSPWNNITLADFVMPWFLFMVGTSAAFSLRKFKTGARADRVQGSKFVFKRAVKLYLLGVLLQGGGWFRSYSYGFNLSTVRWCGILNRIGFAYLVVGLMEIWVPEIGNDGSQSNRGCHLFRAHAWKQLIALGFVLLHIALSFGTYVPSWESQWGWNMTTGQQGKLFEPFTIACDLRGAKTMENPACSATGFFDRALFGQDHLGVWMSRRLPECSSCSPGAPNHLYNKTCHYIPPSVPGPNSTADTRWCFAHIYDPEGSLATLPTVMSAYLGTHFGRVAKSLGAHETPRRVLIHWSVASTLLMAVGLVIHSTWWKMNKQLWSTSYVYFMAGTCGAALTVVYALVDAPVRRAAIGGPRSPGRTWYWFAGALLYPLQTFGMNSILAFCWHGTAESLLNIVYVEPPVAGDDGGGSWRKTRGFLFGEGYGWFNVAVLGGLSPEAGQLVYALLKIACFMVALWYCARVGYFWKV